MLQILSLFKNARTMIQGYKTYIMATMAILAAVNQLLGLGLEFSAGNISLLAFGKQAWQLWLSAGLITGAAKVNRLIASAGNSK